MSNKPTITAFLYVLLSIVIPFHLSAQRKHLQIQSVNLNSDAILTAVSEFNIGLDIEFDKFIYGFTYGNIHNTNYIEGFTFMNERVHFIPNDGHSFRNSLEWKLNTKKGNDISIGVQYVLKKAWYKGISEMYLGTYNDENVVKEINAKDQIRVSGIDIVFNDLYIVPINEQFYFFGKGTVGLGLRYRQFILVRQDIRYYLNDGSTITESEDFPREFRPLSVYPIPIFGAKIGICYTFKQKLNGK